MNEIANTHFEYALVSDETARSLKAKKNQLDGIYFRYTSEVGQVLYEAQQELADYNNDGLFAKWVEAAGFKRQRAYEYINIYKYAVRITDNEELEIFEKQPKSIQTEMSKPSAIPQANQAVYDGEITKHKDYKEWEKEFKEKEQQLNKRVNLQLEIIDQKNDTINKQAEEVRKLKQQEPQVVTKTVEKFPEDYEQLKRTTEQLQNRNGHLEKEHQKLLDDRKNVDEKSKKYDQLNEAIEQSQGKLNQTQKTISNYNNLHKLLKESNEFLTKASTLIYSDVSEVIQKDVLAKQELNYLLSRLERFNRDINNLLSQEIILEGEIINE